MTMSDLHDGEMIQTRRPYADAAAQYWAAGWRGILPVPYGTKQIRVTGWTGNHGAWPSRPDLQAWIDGPEGDGNIALRMPPNVLGIDVDHYDGKPGGAVLHQLEQQHGPLPATWRTTSRDDGISGIRLYRIPEGLRWPGVLGPGIETVRTGHRYAITWPSTHPGGNTYRWINPDGHTTVGHIPTPNELPELPHTWVTALTHGEQATDQATAGLAPAAVTAWLTAKTVGTPCRCIDNATTRALTDLTTTHSGARHDTALAATNRILWHAGEGHTGAGTALTTIRNAFLTAVAGDRAPGDAEHEWDRMITGGVDKIATDFPLEPNHPDPCDPFAGILPPRTEPPCPPTSTETSSDPSDSSPSANTATPTTTSTTTSPTHGSTTSASTNASEATSGPTNTAEQETDSASATEVSDDSAGSTSTDIDPQLLLLYAAAQQENLLTDVADLHRRRAAQRILDAADEDQTIADRVRKRTLDERANREWRKQSAGAQEPPTPVTLTDLLARHLDPIRYRVSGLWPIGGRIVLAAPAKAGKSTAVMNLVHALADGLDFLGAYPVHPPAGRIIVIDNELDDRQIQENYAAQGILNTDKITVIPLRGKLSTFDILDPVIRSEWSETIRQLDPTIVIFDCLRPLIDSLGLSEDKDAGRVLVAFDALLSECGAEDGLVVHHMGHSGERSRGDTRIRDWPDAEWKIVKDKVEDGENDDNAARYFSAFGRNVNVPESKLDLDPAGKHLTIAGGNRQDAKILPAFNAVRDLLQEASAGGLSGNAIETRLQESEHGRNEIRKAYKWGVEKGYLEVTPGPDRGKFYTLSRTGSPRFATRSPGSSGEPTEPVRQNPLKGSGAGEPNEPNQQPVRHHEAANLCTDCGATINSVRSLLGATRCETCSADPKRAQQTLCGHCGKDITDDLHNAPNLTRCRRCRHLTNGSERDTHTDPATGLTVDPNTGEVL